MGHRVTLHSSDGEEIDITGMTVGLISDPDHNLGLYNKYCVRYKADAEPEHKLELCDLFVLDLVHDQFALPTLKEYSQGELLPDQPYTVERLIDPEGKHRACTFFVLNLTTDERARKATAKYVELCRTFYPALAHELSEKILRNTLKKDATHGESEGWGRWEVTKLSQGEQTTLGECEEGGPTSKTPE